MPPAPEAAGKPLVIEVLSLAYIAVGVMLFIAACSSQHASSFFAAILHGLQWLFGAYGALGVAIAMVALGIVMLVRMKHLHATLTTAGAGVIFLASIGMCQLAASPVWPKHPNFIDSPGGAVGTLIACGFHALLGDLAWVILVFLTLCGIAMLTEVPLWQVLLWPFKMLYLGLRAVAVPIGRGLTDRRAAERAAKVAALQEAELRDNPARPRLRLPRFTPPTAAESEDAPATPRPAPIFRPAVSDTPAEHDPEPEAPSVTGVPSPGNPDQLKFADETLAPKGRRREPREATKSSFTLPPMDLLTVTPKPKGPVRDDTAEKAAKLEETLANFGIEGKVVGVERGPRVIRFEVVPPPGIRVNRIVNLADDLALALEANDVRIEAPVPGKGVVGIEVPTKGLAVVDLREILEAEVITKSKGPLTFALGKDIAGKPRGADLTKMPHLLIAGQTNSGKSVCINALLCSLLMRYSPQQVKLLLVDPKRVELSLYQSIPHLIAPVAYDARHAAGLLRWAIREMEQRYEWFADKGVRNIDGFNEQSRLDGLEELPYIVIIIDELADLMMQAAAEFEASICRIAQLARATGIHLVVATQRPSVNVITGTIKANIPSRISFAVASQVDSRTILDMNGAERLVGYGDMLYLPVDAAKPVRIQGAYVSEKDTNAIVDYVKSQGKPVFSDEIAAIEEEALREELGSDGMSDEPEDEMFERALDFIRSTKYASTSMLQRKFRIGYTRAARLMDKFEELGYVGPGQGSKPREVIFAPSTSVTGRPRPGATYDDDPDFNDEADAFSGDGDSEEDEE
jgi:S-DNA-T family DNA segregation ATPase FtsK/SpoIIIE